MVLLWVLAGCTGGSGEVKNSAAPPSGVHTPTAGPTAGNGQYQEITGLGVNANVHSWRNGELRPAIDRIAAMGDVTWRVIIDKSDWEAGPNPASPPSIDWAYYEPIYSHGKMADLWDTISYIKSKPGQEVMLSVMGAVPAWMGGSRINSSSEDQWVRMMASMIAYGRMIKKLDFSLVSPLNEIDHDGIEGPQVPPQQYVRLMHKLLDSLDNLGLSDIRLVGPDTASPGKAISGYLPAMVRDPRVMSRTAKFGIHSYNGDSAGAKEALEAIAPGVDLWVTEFSGACPGCDNGAPNPSDWGLAQGTAALAIELLESGASGLQQYDAWDGYYEHHQSMGYWGLLAYDGATHGYAPRKTYFVVKQLLQFVPRNSVRVPVLLRDDAISVVAFLHSATGRITVFGLNASASERTVDISFPDSGRDAHLQEYVTDPAHDMVVGDGATLARGKITYRARASSVFTLTGLVQER